MNEDELTNEQARKRAARGAMSVFTRHLVVRLMAFAGTLVLARMIDPHTFGIFALAQFVLLLANAAAVGGVTTALTRRHEKVTPLEYRTGHSIQLILATIIFGVVLAATPMIADLYELTGAEAWAFPAMAAAVFLQALRSIPTAALQRGLRHDMVAVSEVAEYITYVVVSISLALLGYGLWALVIAMLMRYLVATILLYRLARGLPGVAFDRAIARRIVGETVPQQLAILTSLGQRAVNTTVVAAVFNPAAAGLVGMAITLLDSLVLQPLTLLSNIQFRLLARAQGDPDQFRKVLAQGFFLSSVICVPILVGSVLLFPLIVSIIFPPSWQQTGFLVQILSISALTQVVCVPTAQALKATGNSHSLIICYLASALTQLAILLTLGDRFGLTGFAIANIAGNLVQLIYGSMRLSIAMKRVPPFGPVAAVVLAGSMASIVGVALAIAIADRMGAIVGAFVGGVVYIAALFVTAPQHVAAHLRLANEVLPDKWVIPRRLLGVLARFADRFTTLEGVTFRLKRFR